MGIELLLPPPNCFHRPVSFHRGAVCQLGHLRGPTDQLWPVVIVPLPPPFTLLLRLKYSCHVLTCSHCFLYHCHHCNVRLNIGKWLIGGSIPEKSKEGQLYNTCVVFNPEGHIVAKHRKVVGFFFSPIIFYVHGQASSPSIIIPAGFSTTPIYLTPQLLYNDFCKLLYLTTSPMSL